VNDPATHTTGGTGNNSFNHDHSSLKDYQNIFEMRFNLESTLIIVSTPRVMRVFRSSAFSVQERKAGILPLLPPER